MGSGMGVASGFGKLGMFGMDQPVLAVSGDSTFFHAVLPALVNAAHHKSDITLVVLDNSGTAMTGFQPHPGLTIDAMGDDVPAIDIARVCEAMGAKVEIKDPFDIEETEKSLNRLLEDKGGVKVLILQQACALSPDKKHRKPYHMHIDEKLCLGEDCGCNRLCTRIFLCPGLFWDKGKKKAVIDEVLCVGCGVCSTICPRSAIEKKEMA
jgi:indolepyruvate ferredoxin oxidoreductase alpha subunit